MHSKSSIPELKAKVISQLNENSSEFVEAWKQQNRNKKHQVFQNRQQLLSEISDYERKPANIDLSKKSIQELKKLAMTEIRTKSKSGDFTEEWRQKILADKVEVYGARQQVVSEIASKKAKELKKMLKEVKTHNENMDKMERKSALLAEIRRQGKADVIIPEWKEKHNNQKRNTMENKRDVLSELSTADKTTLLETVCDILTQRARFLDNIRNLNKSQPTVESWKQENRNNISNPMILKQQMMNDIITQQQKDLKSTEEPRIALMKDIMSQQEPKIEAWKIRNNTQRAQTIKNKHEIICDINEKKGESTLTKEANRTNLLEQIRNASAQKSPVNAPVVEAWRQDARNNKSQLMMAKKRVLVDVEAPTAKKMLKTVEKSDIERHSNLMNCIRIEIIVPAWKQAVNNERITTIQMKNKIGNEITENLVSLKLNLKNNNSVQENKTNLMKDVRSKAGNFTEAWKESQCNQRAVTIGCKSVINQEIKENNKSLKSTKNQTELKSEALKELRMKADMSVPKWKEDILDEQSTIKGNRNDVICDIKNKKSLSKTLSFNEQRSKCLSEIRKGRNPIPEWKESEQNKKSEFYTARREVNFDISEKKFTLENSKSQTELRNECLKEIRSKNVDCVVPVWKEKKLEKRTEVFNNKQKLNRCIEVLKIM